MKISMKTIYFRLPLLLCLMTINCATVNGLGHSVSRTFNAPYDRVWNALNKVICDDMGCALKEADKKKGFLETEWVYVIGMEGTRRWKIIADAKKKGNSVKVRITKKVQLRDDSSRSINMYREKTHNHSESRAGWKTKGVDNHGIESIYTKVEEQLKAPETDPVKNSKL